MLKLKRWLDHGRTLALWAALCLVADPARAVPFVYLETPATVNASETFHVKAVLDGLDSGPFGSDELLAFAFRVDLQKAGAPGPDLFLFNGYSLGPGFQDDTALLFPGATVVVAGSAFPGIAAGPILLADLSLQAPGHAGTWSLGFDDAFMQANGNAGIYTLLYQRFLQAFHGGASIRVTVPEGISTGLLLGVVLCALGGVAGGRRAGCRSYSGH